MKGKYMIRLTIHLLCLMPSLLLAQNGFKTIPNETDRSTEYYILDEDSDSTQCYLYLFKESNNYMLLINYHISQGLTQSYFLSQGEYTAINQQITLRDDVNNLIMRAQRNDFDDLIFEHGLDFMNGATFVFAEQTTQLPGPPYRYIVSSDRMIQTAIEKSRTTEYHEQIADSRYQTKLFSNHLLADLKLKDDQTFTYHFMHYPLMLGTWQQENRLVTLTSESGVVFYGSIEPSLLDFIVIQLPGFIFASSDNSLLYRAK